MEIAFESYTAVAGFQFDVTGTQLYSAGGGLAGEAERSARADSGLRLGFGCCPALRCASPGPTGVGAGCGDPGFLVLVGAWFGLVWPGSGWFSSLFHKGFFCL